MVAGDRTLHALHEAGPQDVRRVNVICGRVTRRCPYSACQLTPHSQRNRGHDDTSAKLSVETLESCETLSPSTAASIEARMCLVSCEITDWHVAHHLSFLPSPGPTRSPALRHCPCLLKSLPERLPN